MGRLFKRSTTTSGGYLQPELADRQESLCNFEPEVFVALSRLVLARSFDNFWPTHTYIASNEADTQLIMDYLSGFPGPRRNVYSAADYDAAVTVAESVVALRSILIDAMVCALA